MSGGRSRKLGVMVGAVAGILFLAVVLGPRVELDTTLHPSSIPEVPKMSVGPGIPMAPQAASVDSPPWPGARILEDHLAAGEALVPDIIPGTEKTIVWADPENPAPTEYVVVYLHGFSATRQETTPLSERLAEALGANLFLTRLTGHGRTSEAMADGSVNAWVNDGAEALELATRIGRRIVLVGTSTGGTLAVWLAAQTEWDPALTPWKTALEALILISPNFGPRDKASSVLLWPWGGQIVRLAEGPERCWEPHNELQGRFWTTCDATEALLPMMGLVALANEVEVADLTVPAFVFYSPEDQVVDTGRILLWYAGIGSPWKGIMGIHNPGDPSSHVLAGEILSPSRTDWMAGLVAEFVRDEG